jgi:hypothetical protein
MRRGIVVVAILFGYAWVVAGAVPFSSISYFLVAIPSVVIAVAYGAMGGFSPHRSDISAYYQRRAAGATLSTIAPWITVLSAAALLEFVGLLLGGHSTSVPTLSTTVDHLLAARWERCLLCLAWLLVGAIPLIRLRKFVHVGDS